MFFTRSTQLFAALLAAVGIGFTANAKDPAKTFARDFAPVLEKVTVDGKIFFEDGQKAKTLAVKADKPLVIQYFFKNTGTAAPSENGRIFVHFTDAKKKGLTGGDFDPKTPTTKWQKDFSGAFPRTVNLKKFKGQTVKVFLGMYFPKQGGVRLAIKGCGGSKRIYVGSLTLE